MLASIAVAMAVGGGEGVFSTVPTTQAIIAAYLVEVGIIGSGLFVNGPVDEPEDFADPVDALN